MRGFQILINGGLACFLTLSLSACRNEATQPRTYPSKEKQTKTSSEGSGHHPSGYATSGLHGAQYMADQNSCKKCHGKNLQGGSLVAFSCNKCHSSFPHSEEFKKVENRKHGSAYFANRMECTQCHGADYSGGKSKVSCQKCHTYPHRPKWAQPEQHGQKYVSYLAKQRETIPEVDWGDAKSYTYDKCMKCHGEKESLKERHPKEHVSCGKCHMPMPHMERVQTLNKRGRIKWKHHDRFAETFKYGCLSCHSQQGKHPDTGQEGLLYNRLSPSTQQQGCYYCHDESQEVSIEFPQGG